MSTRSSQGIISSLTWIRVDIPSKQYLINIQDCDHLLSKSWRQTQKRKAKTPRRKQSHQVHLSSSRCYRLIWTSPASESLTNRKRRTQKYWRGFAKIAWIEQWIATTPTKTSKARQLSSLCPKSCLKIDREIKLPKFQYRIHIRCSRQV